VNDLCASCSFGCASDHKFGEGEKGNTGEGEFLKKIQNGYLEVKKAMFASDSYDLFHPDSQT
jgi:hypothetical protein